MRVADCNGHLSLLACIACPQVRSSSRRVFCPADTAAGTNTQVKSQPSLNMSQTFTSSLIVCLNVLQTLLQLVCLRGFLANCRVVPLEQQRVSLLLPSRDLQTSCEWNLIRFVTLWNNMLYSIKCGHPFTASMIMDPAGAPSKEEREEEKEIYM